MLTQEYLKSILHYCPETGIFTWKISGKMSGKSAGAIMNRGYIHIKIKGKSYLGHRLAWLYTYGYFPREIDHINNIRTDNRLNNIREATPSQNRCNSRLNAKNNSGIKGVHFHARSKGWQGQVTINKIRISKCFRLKKDASEWVADKRTKLHGEFANHG